jgi:transcriptional regulator with XRE-family HTH domain
MVEEVIARLIAAVDASGMKQNHIGRVSGLGKTKVNKILNRKQEPTISDFIAIAHAINVDPGRLFTDGELVVGLEELCEAHAASRRLQKILEAWLPDAQPAPPMAGVPPARPPRRHDATPVRAAANPNAEMVVELEMERKRIPRRFWNRGARIIARTDGHSMDGGSDPIKDGELVYLKPTRSPRTASNKVVLCRVDDGLYLKRFEKSGRTIRLVSTNDPHVMELDAPTANLQIYGILVDHAPE